MKTFLTIVVLVASALAQIASYLLTFFGDDSYQAYAYP